MSTGESTGVPLAGVGGRADGAHRSPTALSGVLADDAIDESLSHRRLGVGALVFMIIAASAPLTVLAGGIPTSFGVTGVLGVPLGYLLLGAVLALFSVGYGAMSASIHNAGAFYAYIAAGLGVRQGIGASVLALVCYNTMQVGMYGLFGFSLSSLLAAKIGLSLPWWVSALIGWAVVAAMGVNRIDFSAKVISVLVAGEFIVATIVDIIGVHVAPEGHSMAPLSPGHTFVHGVGAMLSFGVAAFMGFESGAVYSEETRNPKKTVARSTFIAVGIISVFYAFSAWALAVGIGPSKIIPQSANDGPNLIFNFLGAHGPGWLDDVANLLFITSLLAALAAFHNASSRYFFALGRTGVISRWFDHTSPRTGAPRNGSLSQTAIGLVVILVFAWAGHHSPDGAMFPVVTLFTWFSNAAAFGLVFLLAVTSVAVVGYFRGRPQEHGTFTRLIAPGLSAICLAVIFVLIMVNFSVLIGSSSKALVALMPGLIIATGLVGMVRGEYMRRFRPDAFEQAAHHLDQKV